MVLQFYLKKSVQIKLLQGPNAGAEFQARIPGTFDLLGAGQIMARVDPERVFPYPALLAGDSWKRAILRDQA